MNGALTISPNGTGNTGAVVHMCSPLVMGLMGNVILKIMACNGGAIETDLCVLVLQNMHARKQQNDLF